MVASEKVIQENANPVYTVANQAPYLEVEAVKITKMELDYELILERSRVVTIAPARMPMLGLKGRYNKRWFVDIITLPHNAIRRQLNDVYSTLIAMHKMALDVTENDFQLFYGYLANVFEFFVAIFQGEEEALYEHIRADSGLKSKIMGTEEIKVLDPEHRGQVKKEILTHLEECMKYRYVVVPSLEALAHVQASIDAFSRKALDYFAEKEESFPKFLAKSIRGSKEKNRYEARLIAFLLMKPRGNRFVAMLAQVLVSPEVRGDFCERHFPKPEQKASFDESVVEMDSEVNAFAKAIEAAAQTYEKCFSIGTFMEHYGKDRDPDTTTELVS
jgi:hypothetical protein